MKMDSESSIPFEKHEYLRDNVYYFKLEDQFNNNYFMKDKNNDIVFDE